jgi:hypothetical protein
MRKAKETAYCRGVLFFSSYSVIDFTLTLLCFVLNVVLLICTITLIIIINFVTDLSVDRDDSLCGPKVTVPQLDDETFTSFFSSSTSLMSKSEIPEQLNICDEDLDQVVCHSRKL